MIACWTAGCEDEATHHTRRLYADELVIPRCSTHTQDYCDQMTARGIQLVVSKLAREARNEH